MTARARACYSVRVRALPTSVARAAVAVLLLALFAAPLARAGSQLGARPHACCPKAPAPDPAPPCQQMAPLSCCLEVGVPPAPSSVDRPDAPELALPPAPLAEPVAPALRLLAAHSCAEGPPLDPLAQSCVLLL